MCNNNEQALISTEIKKELVRFLINVSNECVQKLLLKVKFLLIVKCDGTHTVWFRAFIVFILPYLPKINNYLAQF